MSSKQNDYANVTEEHSQISQVSSTFLWVLFTSIMQVIVVKDFILPLEHMGQVNKR